MPDAGNRSYPPEKALFHLEKDPYELRSVHLDPAYADVRRTQTLKLWDLPQDLGDSPHPCQPVPEGRTR